MNIKDVLAACPECGGDGTVFVADIGYAPCTMCQWVRDALAAPIDWRSLVFRKGRTR